MALLSNLTGKKGVIRNRTFKYLTPPMGYYGNEFINKIKSLKLIAFGISDYHLDNKFITDRECIFVLYDSAYFPRKTTDTLSWFYNQEYFIENTYYTDYMNTLRYLILELPIPGVLPKFLQGKYSEMYTREEISKFFTRNSSLHALKVITKNEVAIEEHIDRVNKLFKTNLKRDDIDLFTFECDFKPQMEDEVFNYTI